MSRYIHTHTPDEVAQEVGVRAHTTNVSFVALDTLSGALPSQSVVSCSQFRLRFREIGQSREGEGKRDREGVWHAVLRCSYPSLSFATGLHIVCRLHTHKTERAYGMLS